MLIEFRKIYDTYKDYFFLVESKINEIRQCEVFLETSVFLLVNDLTYGTKQLDVLKRWILSTPYVRVLYKILFTDTKKMTMQTFEVTSADFKGKENLY